MLNKLNLDSTRSYEVAIATKIAAKMLASFVIGSGADLCFGSEQGNVETWDDLVIAVDRNTEKHVQVKRQATPFSSYEVERGAMQKGNSPGSPQQLSALDKSK